jgi:pimeloyl-ACP methyl ester carboxylesterase
MKKVRIGEIDIAYYTRGIGKPLVMIMGFRGTMGQWDPALLEELEKYYTLILFDNRGVGFSTDTEKDLTTIQQMAQDTVGLIQALGSVIKQLNDKRML